jgi:hypothetical protein
VRTAQHLRHCKCGRIVEPRGKAPPHAFRYEVTYPEHSVGHINATLNFGGLKLLEPPAMHMQNNPGLRQPSSDERDELRDVHDVNDIAVMQRRICEDPSNEVAVPQIRIE